MSTKTKKKKTVRLAVVSDSFIQFPLRHILEALAAKWQVSACVQDVGEGIGALQSSLAFRLFAPIKDMPGYMRGVEDELGEADIILADGASHLSTFQAVRAGLKHGIPVAVYSSETDFSRFRDFANITAIQSDVLAHADMFLASHGDAEQALVAEGVPATRIAPMGMGVMMAPDGRSSALRKRFRDYLKVSTHDVFVGFSYDATTLDKAADGIQALRLVRTQNPSLAQRMLILFMGAADQAMELKYRVYDLGLSRQVKFLHQETSGFRHDLHAALDAMILTRGQVHSLSSALPWLEGLAEGVIPVMPEGAMLSQLMQPCALLYRDDSFSGLAQPLHRLLTERPRLETMSEDVRRFIAAHFNANTVALQLEELLTTLRRDKRQGEGGQTFRDILEKAEEDLHAGRWQEVSVAVEDLKLRAKPNQARELGRLHWLKGQVALQQQFYDEAVAAFSESVAYDGQCWPSYLGLAQVAFLSHAHDEARRFYRKVLSLSPENAQAMLGLGMICRRLEEVDEALVWFRECLKKEPDNVRALTAFMQGVMEVMSTDEAVSLLEATRDIVGDVPNLMRALGQLYIRQGNVELGNSLLAGLNDELPTDGVKSA